MFTEEKIARYIKEGRGSGEGASYLPWLTINDFPSKGVESRDKGWTTGRSPHQFLSNGELNYFYHLEWADEVIDIREQYPLDRDRTRSIARRLGVKHPRYPHSDVDMVMTTDFFIKVIRDGKVQFLARTYKPSLELQDPSVIKNFMIEYVYWHELRMSWGIVTDKEVPNKDPNATVRALKWLHPYYDRRICLPELADDMLDAITHCVLHEVHRAQQCAKTLRLAGLGYQIDDNFNLESTTGLRVMRHLLATKQLLFNLRDGIEAASPVCALRLPESSKPNLREVG